MTEPRPRLTRTIGSVQQISVVSDDVSPRRLITRSRIDSSFAHDKAHHDPRWARQESDQQAVGMEVRRVVRAREDRNGTEGVRGDRRFSSKHRKDPTDRDQQLASGRHSARCHSMGGVPHVLAAVVRCAQASARVVGFGAAGHCRRRISKRRQRADRQRQDDQQQAAGCGEASDATLHQAIVRARRRGIKTTTRAVTRECHSATMGQKIDRIASISSSANGVAERVLFS